MRTWASGGGPDRGRTTLADRGASPPRRGTLPWRRPTGSRQASQVQGFDYCSAPHKVGSTPPPGGHQPRCRGRAAGAPAMLAPRVLRGGVVRLHLREPHDELRAAAAFGCLQARAAAVTPPARPVRGSSTNLSSRAVRSCRSSLPADHEQPCCTCTSSHDELLAALMVCSQWRVATRRATPWTRGKTIRPAGAYL